MRFFQGCTALVTGASAGLGAEFCRQLAPLARTLIMVARREDRLQALREELSACFPHLDVRIYRADLRSEPERNALAAWLDQQGIRVNFLINNAGLGDLGPFLESEFERVKAMLETNITALTHLTHLLAPGMVADGRGAVLNVSSIAGFFPIPNMAVYAATKAYVTSFTEALRMELRPLGVTVTALCPGPVPTEFQQVAARPGKEPRFLVSPHALTATPREVVEAGLRAVAAERARSIPNPLLCLLISLILLMPFCLVRPILSSLAKKT